MNNVRTMPLLSDAPPVRTEPLAPQPTAQDASAFARALDALGATFDRAQGAEDAFAAGAGSLQDAVYSRARADVAIAVATATVGRVVQSVQSLLNMQV